MVVWAICRRYRGGCERMIIHGTSMIITSWIWKEKHNVNHFRNSIYLLYTYGAFAFWVLEGWWTWESLNLFGHRFVTSVAICFELRGRDCVTPTRASTEQSAWWSLTTARSGGAPWARSFACFCCSEAFEALWPPRACYCFNCNQTFNILTPFNVETATPANCWGGGCIFTEAWNWWALSSVLLSDLLSHAIRPLIRIQSCWLSAHLRSEVSVGESRARASWYCVCGCCILLSRYVDLIDMLVHGIVCITRLWSTWRRLPNSTPRIRLVLFESASLLYHDGPLSFWNRCQDAVQRTDMCISFVEHSAENPISPNLRPLKLQTCVLETLKRQRVSSPGQFIAFLWVICCLSVFVYSLVKIDDDRLQALLDEIQTMRKFQS